MSGTPEGTRVLDETGVVQLAVLDRDGFDESRHLGAAVVVSADGEELARHGDADALMLPRSAMKAFIAQSFVDAGLRLDAEATALSAASHSGTPRHIRVVERMLHDAGLDETALQCPAVYPDDAASARAAAEPRRIFYTCSGKHAGFLATAQLTGSDPSTYLDPTHPVQRAVIETFERYTGEKVQASAVDGCGAPVHAVTLRGLGRGVSRIAVEDGPIARAVRAEPWAIEGPGESDTVVIERLGLFVKTGAEGVWTASTRGGVAVALKIADGSARAAAAVGLTLLARVGAIDADAAEQTITAVTAKVLGGGRPVGRVRVAV